MLFRKSLTGILSGFDKIAADLEKHVEKSAQKHFKLLDRRDTIDSQINKTAAETDRAHRVLSKLQELTA